MWCVTPASPDPVRMLLHDVRRVPAYTQRRVHTRLRVYAPRAAFAHMRIDAVVGAYTHRAGSRTPGCVYAQVGAYTCEVGSLELGCVYAAPAGARIFRYWSRYTQVGAYTRKCTGCVPTQRVSFRKVSARVRGGAGAVDGTNGQDDRAHGPRSERTPDRADARRTPKPQRDAVRTLHSADEGGGTFAQPRALSQRPQTAIRESRYGACATPRLLCQPHAAWTL